MPPEAATMLSRPWVKLWRAWVQAFEIPLAGFGGMAYVFVKSFVTVSKPGYNYSPPLLGIQLPIVIGIGGLLLGLVFMILQWIYMPAFFRRKLETANPRILEEHLDHVTT